MYYPTLASGPRRYLTGLLFTTFLVATALPFSLGATDAAQTPRILVISIGLDRSLTMAGASLADLRFIRRVAMIALSTGRPVLLTFDAIAAPSDLALLRLELRPTATGPARTLSEKAKLAAKNRRIQADNQQQLELFLEHCRQRIAKADLESGSTDLTGHLHKVNRLMSEAHLAAAQRMVFIQTDGYQDIVNKKRNYRFRRLTCPDWAAGIALYASNWENPEHCGFRFFESPEGFLQFLSSTFKSH